MNKYTVSLISLGCAKNLVDSEIILGMLDESTFEIISDTTKANILIINTCGFIEASKQESINTIIDSIGKNKYLVVTGCLVERYLDDLKKEIPEVNLWVPIREYKNLNIQLTNLIKSKEIIKEFNPLNRVLSTPFYTAFLRISEGCNNCCTYCAIPLIRGKFRSRPIDEIIVEAKDLANKGIKELVVISQDTTRYGNDFNDGTTIVTLLEKLLEIKGFYSIRLLYLYPDEISRKLVDLIKNNSKLSPYFDIPLQHASNNVLKAMNRRGDNKSYSELIKYIRNEIPNAILRTTMIVGFPGETDEDFENLCSFIKENEFDHLGAFTYSREEGTASYEFENQIDNQIKLYRYNKLMKIQHDISQNKNLKHVGEIMEGIVVDYNTKSNKYLLRSYWNAPDDIDGNIYFVSAYKLNIGDVVKVKINKSFAYDLDGELIKE